MDIDKLKEALKMRNLSLGIKDGEPVLTPSKNNPEISYVHISNFIEALDEKGLTVDVGTMKIGKIPDPVTKPETPPTGPTTEVKTVDDVAAEKNKPEETPKVETWTEDELRTIKLKDDLIKIAAIDPDVNTKGTKEELIIKLIGRPKTFE